MNSFDNIDISTETIIGKTNWKININDLFLNLPITDYKVIPKKRGRRPKEEKKVEPQELKDGDIITLKLGDKVRGVDLKLKKKSKSDKNYFRNSITIVMHCDGKLINFKISKNGKFQFTGCKNDINAHKCLDFVKSYVDNKKVLGIPSGVNTEVLYITVMANINFSLGFCVNKENLDDYVNKNTQYYSLLESSFGYTGVNIKIPLSKLDNIPITKMVFNNNTGLWEYHKLTYNDYVNLLDEKEKYKEKNKTRYNTFLVFQSGNVILSSPHKECMRDTYHEFLNIINNCRPIIEEKIE